MLLSLRGPPGPAFRTCAAFQDDAGVSGHWRSASRVRAATPLVFRQGRPSERAQYPPFAQAAAVGGCGWVPTSSATGSSVVAGPVTAGRAARAAALTLPAQARAGAQPLGPLSAVDLWRHQRPVD